MGFTPRNGWHGSGWISQWPLQGGIVSHQSLLKRVLRSPRRPYGVARSFWSLVLGLVIASGPVAAGKTSGECTKEELGGDYSIMDILDDGIPLDVRLANVEVLKRYAQHPSCTESRYLLGSLYQHGPELPGNPLPKDTGQARRLIESHGLDGNAYAFAQLAELALAEGNAVEAMQWTQVYLYLVTHHKGNLIEFERSGYNANLLMRAEKAWRKSKSSRGDATPESLLNAYFDRNPSLGQRAAQVFESSHETDEAAKSEAGFGAAGLRVKRRNNEVTVNFRMEPGYAIYVLEIQPSGQVSRIAVQTFAPTPAHATKLRALVEGWEYYPHRGEKAEIIRVPVMFGFDGPRLKGR
jgi:hypothetical protein